LGPRFFKTPADFRKWLERNHAKETELIVGFYKAGSGKKAMKYAEAVDVALCFGWIDGKVQRIDDVSYRQRFSPRKPKSSWSRINVARFAELEGAGLVHPAGRKAFDARTASSYSYEAPRELSDKFLKRLRANEKAWTFFEAQPPGYRRNAAYWVTSAKREETRERRFAQLVECSQKGERIPQFLG
jgi:uncharacterized protein YdeI (YjbR/CyaY-like superfamily)